MTAIGRFSILSETTFNPSIVTFFMTLSGPALTAVQLQQLWTDRNMPEMHPRFHSTVSRDRAGYFQQHYKHENNDSDKSKEMEQFSNAKNNNENDQKRKAKALRDFLSMHVTETLYPAVETARQDLTARIIDLQTLQWPLTDSLWHVYVGSDSKSACSASRSQKSSSNNDDDDSSKTTAKPPSSIVLFRGHHALADGASMGAALLDLCDEAAAMKQQIVDFMADRRRKHGGRKTWWQRLYQQCLFAVQLLAGSVVAVMHQLKLYLYVFWEQSLTLKSTNPWQVLKQEAAATAAAAAATTVDVNGVVGTAPAPTRTVSYTQAAPVEQAKWVASVLGGDKATINDVFLSCVTAALAKQLAWHRERRRAVQQTSTSIDNSTEHDDKNSLPRQRHMHIAVPVHLKGGVILPGESVSNQLGAFCVRLPGEVDDDIGRLDSAERLQAVHKELASVKRTPAAFLSHWTARALTQSTHILPAAWLPFIFSKASAGAVAVVTNTRGAPDYVHMDGRRVESIYGFVPLPPGIPVGVVVSSYAGSMALTVTAEPYAVPDADRFMSWVLEEYVSLLKKANQVAKDRGSSEHGN
jgi:hypothetical protein